MNSFILRFSKLSPFMIVFLTTFFVLLGSVPSVYFVTKIYGVEYDSVHIILSIVLPMLLTPPVIYTFIKLSKHLNYFNSELQKEIEKNKIKDIMLFEQARFVLMGEMMANISHQWKQPLNNVGLAVVSSRLSDLDEVREKNFDIMEENINYLSNTIDDFMSFFDRKTSIELRAVENIVDEIQSIMRAQIESCGIKLTINIEEKIKIIKMKSVISQVILNLLNNAKDAIDESKSEKEIVLNFKAISNGFQISCCDNGLGIDKKITTKIFDPYFTTKEKKQGTGIGLYMSKQIVDKIFDGKIILDNMSKSTCFKIDISYSKNCKLEEVLES